MLPAVFRAMMLFMLLAGMAVPSHALVVRDLYEAEVLVTEESNAALRSGARSGLMQVLIRTSGTTDVETNELILGSMRSPETYYYQYSFESTPRTLMVNEEEVPARLLRIQFEPSAIAGLLRSAGFPVWGSNRPSVLLWIAVGDGLERRILTEDDMGPLADSLRKHARLRGLPLLFPLMDLEDAGSISTAEIWGAFLGRIDDASIRYNPDSILSARIRRDARGRWEGNWAWRIDGDWQVLDTSATTPEELASGMIDHLANELGERYALTSARSQVVLTVEAVGDLKSYAAVARYLESLSPVLSSNVTRVDGDVVEFELATEGQNEQLLQVIELDERMVLLNSSDNLETLHYRWMR